MRIAPYAPRVSRWLFVAIVLVATTLGCSRRSETVPTAAASASAGASILPPSGVLEPIHASIPDALPLTGDAGDDAFGRPRRAVDRIALQSLFHARKFEELCRYITTFQTDFEADAAKEQWPLAALDAFNAVTRTSGALHDAWIAATPSCFAAYAARGNYFYTLGMGLRGTGTSSETSRAQFAAMEQAFRYAAMDLSHAIELRPRLVAAYATSMQLYAARGDRESVERAQRSASEACPDCVEWRISYLRAVRTEWGGESGDAARYVRGIDLTRSRAMHILSGYTDYDACYELRRGRRAEAALPSCERAISAAGYWRYYFERARVLRALRRLPEALADLDRALELAPQQAGPMLERVYALNDMGRPDDAIIELATVAHLLPDDTRVPQLARIITPQVEGLLRVRANADPERAEALERAVRVLRASGATTGP